MPHLYNGVGPLFVSVRLCAFSDSTVDILLLEQFVVYKVTLRQVFLRIRPFSAVSIIPPLLHIR
jgi:hypothetical protein